MQHVRDFHTIASAEETEDEIIVTAFCEAIHRLEITDGFLQFRFTDALKQKIYISFIIIEESTNSIH